MGLGGLQHRLGLICTDSCSFWCRCGSSGRQNVHQLYVLGAAVRREHHLAVQVRFSVMCMPCIAVWLAFITQLAVMCQVFGCVGDLSRACGRSPPPPMVSIISFHRVERVGSIWVLFGRYRSQISDNNRSSYNVHTRVFVLVICELDWFSASSLEFPVRNTHPKTN